MTLYSLRMYLSHILLMILGVLSINHAYASTAKIVIVIDDLGYRKTDEIALSLPGNITYAVLPHTPFGQKLARQAQQKNHDVLLHIPMESSIDKKLGPGALTTNMVEADVEHQLEKAIQEIPFAIGINNHMGSKLTELYEPMAWTMRVLKKNNMIFLDSMTTTLSLARQTAKQYGVPNLKRHIFLDNILTEENIAQQFTQLIHLSKENAKVNQVAVGIAHPHPTTINTLMKLIPTLANEGITLVNISSALGLPTKKIPNHLASLSVTVQ